MASTRNIISGYGLAVTLFFHRKPFFCVDGDGDLKGVTVLLAGVFGFGVVVIIDRVPLFAYGFLDALRLDAILACGVLATALVDTAFLLECGTTCLY